ncbi:hypothetical protein BDZ91DRAFT_667623, partial [Kalaharituber pfeilii]
MSQSQDIKKGRDAGSQNYSQADKDALLDAIEAVLPTSQDAWERVREQYVVYANDNGRCSRDTASLRKKWSSLINCTKPTGDPTCPDDVRRAKRLDRVIREQVEMVSLDD